MSSAGAPGVDDANITNNEIRDIVKWLTAAFAAVAAALLGGAQLSHIGSVHGWHLCIAVASMLVSLAAVAHAISIATLVLTPTVIPLRQVSQLDPAVVTLINDNVLDLHTVSDGQSGRRAITIDDLDKLYREALEQRDKASQFFETSHDGTKADPDNGKYLDARAVALSSVVEQVLALATSFSLIGRFKSCWKCLLFDACVMALAILSFTWAANPPTEEMPARSESMITVNMPNPGGLAITNPTFEYLGQVNSFAEGDAGHLKANCESQDVGEPVCDSRSFGEVLKRLHQHSAAPELLLILGSADKFDLGSSLKNVYGSNEGLAQARANAMRDCLLKDLRNVPVILTSMSEPSIFGKRLSCNDTATDRSVKVYGMWLSTH